MVSVAAPVGLHLRLPALAGSLVLHLALAAALGSWAFTTLTPVVPPQISFDFLPAAPAPAPDIPSLALEAPLLARAPVEPETTVAPAATEALKVARPQPNGKRVQRPKKGAVPDDVLRAAAASPPAAATATAPELVSAIVAPPVFDADYLRNPPPDYPATARRRRLAGEVILSVLVTAAGLPQNVEVVTSSGHAILDVAARQAVMQWRFVPAQSAGAPVAASVLVPINFQLR